ncbi:MAG: glycosyltransferase [Candidatus Omnitrophica bacterium]|nr:glycosyltransferase [Candidatus Omnitrophota bacterium]
MTAGTGHRRAAEALAGAVRRQDSQAEVVCLDLLAWVPWWLRWAYPKVYQCLVGFLPTLWAIAYYALDRPWIFRLCQLGRGIWNRAFTRRLIRWAGEWQPDVVIATHFFPAEVFGHERRRGRLSARVIVVITDLFPHRLWLTDGADAVVVGSDETKQLCQARGIDGQRLHVLGIPIGSRFDPSTRATAFDRSALTRQWHLDPGRRTVLLVSGGMGLGPVARLVQRLADVERARPGLLQLLVVCGENARLARRLRARDADSGMPVRVFEFVETMPELMAASDLLVTKAGGLTVMEALAMGVPMVLCGVIPGQERFNAEYVVRHGAGILTGSPGAAVEAAIRILDDPQAYARMRSSAMSVGRPQAADEIVERFVCGRLDGDS